MQDARWVTHRRSYVISSVRRVRLWAMVIYGREAAIDALVRSRAPVMLVTGDSGIGKSAVLAAAQQASEGALAPPPLTIPHSGGALQRALLRALGEAVSAYVSEQGRAREIAGNIVAVADRLALEGAQELARVVGRELLAFVRGRIGDDVGKAFVEYLGELKSIVDERLAVRLTAAVDPGVAGLVLDFAEEVCAFAGDQKVVLALDAGELLGEEDVRLLAELAERLPDRLRLRLGFSTSTDRQRGRVEFLLGSGDRIAEQQVPGLDVASIATWLADAELDPGGAAEVARVTGGYALHVGDLIKHLRQGGSIEDAPRHELFARRTNQAWQSLPPEIARHARALCVFADPLPRERLLSFLALDSPTWGEVEDRLWRARIFSVEVNGQRWFHEQRRQYLVGEVLGDAERAEASARAAQALYDLVDQDGAIDRLGELAAVVAAATPLLESDNQLAAAVELTRDELALAASLIEVIEPTSAMPGVRGDVLLDYARSVFGATGDLIEALRRLGQRDLVAIQEGSGMAAAVPYWRSGLVMATIAGRAVRELGRLPVPRAASAVVELLVQPRLGPFIKVRYGLGYPSMGRLSEMAMELRRPSPPPVVIGRPDPGSNLLLRANYAGREVYAAVTFPTASDRDTAQGDLHELSGEVLAQRFELNDVVPHPVDPVPSRRFLEAAERLTGKTLGTALSSSMISLRLQKPLPPEEALRRRAAALRAVRERSSTLERVATQLDEPIGYSYFSDEESFFEAEIRGGREGVEQLREPPVTRWDDPYRLFRLVNLVDLRPGERLGRQNLRLGKGQSDKDPVVDILVRLQREASQFNRHQGRRRIVTLDADQLQQSLTEAAWRNLEDARALAAAVLLGDAVHAPEPRTTHILIELYRPDPGFVEGAFSTASYVHAPNPEGLEQVRVTLVYRIHPLDSNNLGSDLTAGRAWFRQLGLPGEQYDYDHGIGELRELLARMLGHTTDELRLSYPD
jgi:hypothetical protein